MRRLLPAPADDIDLFDAYRPEDAERPLLRLNMVSSLDGAVTDERGRSGGLGRDGDREVFRVLRAHADAIVVGAGTARVEGYGPHRLRADLAERRAETGKPAPAAMVVVSRSLDLDLDAPLFSDARTPTIVVTCERAPDTRLAAVQDAARVIVAGADRVDVRHALTVLREDLGLRHLLCEGGPTLNTDLLEHGLVDELCATISPTVVGSGPRLSNALSERVDLTLAGVLEHEGELFLRYRLG